MVHAFVTVSAAVISASNGITQLAVQSGSIRPMATWINVFLAFWTVGVAIVAHLTDQDGYGKSNQEYPRLAKIVAPLRSSIFWIFTTGIVVIQIFFVYNTWVYKTFFHYVAIFRRFVCACVCVCVCVCFVWCITWSLCAVCSSFSASKVVIGQKIVDLLHV